MAISGGCRCGAVRYALAMETPPAVYACHCRYCQTWSGSAFSEQFMAPEAALAVDGAVAAWTQDGEGGPRRVHTFCAVCHTRLYNTNSAVPGLAIIRAGTLDDSEGLAPIAHIWTSRKQPWVALPADTPTWPESPTPEQFAAALARGARG